MSFGADYFEGETSPYKQGYGSAGVQVEKIHRLVEGYTRRNLKHVSRMLDIGCAYGYFLKGWEGKGIELYGTDISEHAIARARDIVDARLAVADVQQRMPFEDGFFDVITMFEVIQMTQNPAFALQEVHRLLRPGGLFFVTTPNVNSLFRIVRRQKWTGFRDPAHLYLFTATSLAFLLKRSDFQVLQVRTPQLWPFPRRLVKLSSNLPFGSGLWAVATK